MIERNLMTEAGLFTYKIEERRDGSAADVFVTAPCGNRTQLASYPHRAIAETEEWIRAYGVEEELDFQRDLADQELFEWGRDEDLPFAESVMTMGGLG
jgi:hypothetical protein